MSPEEAGPRLAEENLQKTENQFINIIKIEFIEGRSDSGQKYMDIRVGDIVTLKKKHPCGAADWKVLRAGADFRLCCTGCGHQVMMARRVLEKSMVRLERQAES